MSENGIVTIPFSSVAKKVADAIEEKNKPALSKEKWPQTLEYLKNRKDVPSDFPPNCKIKSRKKSATINGCNVHTLYETDCDTVVLYLHGGAYVFDLYERHVAFCDDLAQRTGFEVCVPCYPLSPQHTFSETYELLDKIYEKFLSEKKRILIMGDSAGGGLALGFTMYLKKKGFPLPEKMVLISPFLDLTLSHPDIGKYDEKDILLKKYRLVEFGKMWAGNTPVDDYRLSPINENPEGLPPALIFAGNSELMYLDSVNLHEKLKKCGTESELVIGEGLMHVFVLIKEIPETEKCRKMIAEFIQ